MMKAQGWFSLTLECFRYAALELQTLLISLNSSEMHFQLPATCQSSIRLVFNIVTSRGREINTILFWWPVDEKNSSKILCRDIKTTRFRGYISPSSNSWTFPGSICERLSCIFIYYLLQDLDIAIIFNPPSSGLPHMVLMYAKFTSSPLCGLTKLTLIALRQDVMKFSVWSKLMKYK